MTTIKVFHFATAFAHGAEVTQSVPQVVSGDNDVSRIWGEHDADIIYDNQGEPQSVQVAVLERVDPAFHCYVWPSALLLAKYLWRERSRFGPGTIIVELGAGTGLPGLLAAKLGAHVYLTDRPAAIPALQRAVAYNRLASCSVPSHRGQAHCWPLVWGTFTADGLIGLVEALPSLTWIIGSDVFYEPSDFEAVLVTVAYLLRAFPAARFVTAYQERSASRTIQPWLERWHLTGRRLSDVTLDWTQRDCHDYGSSSVHTLLRRALVDASYCLYASPTLTIMDKEQSKKLMEGIKTKDHTKLKHVTPAEKNVLPTQQDIEEEKKADA